MVPGEGPQPAHGMIVGEAPGKKEVEAGRPFVGRSGQFLETALKSCGIDRSKVYITNVVKEIPLTSAGKIRAPYPEEIEAWRSILEGEVESTAPSAILALGRTAVSTLTGLDGERVPFGSVVGNIYTTWHPSYILQYGQGDREQWFEHVRAWAETLWLGVDE